MPVFLYSLLIASLIGVTGGLVLLSLRHPTARLWPVALCVGVACAAIWYLASGPASTRADRSGESVQEIAAVLLCYGSMLLGMMAEYVYAQADAGRRTLTFEPMTFIMPILASPIVFIPLLTIAGDMTAGGAFTQAKVMVYLVAFQNGFFWKNFFEQRRKEAMAVGRA